MPSWIVDSSESSTSSAEENSTPSATDGSDDNAFSESVSSDDESNVLESGNHLVDLDCLKLILSEACLCKHCGEGDICLVESKLEGLASTVTIVCSNLDCSHSQEFPLAVKTGHYFDCNRRSVLAARFIGCRWVNL